MTSKLSMETSPQINKKFKKINSKIKNDKQQHINETDELQQENEYLREKLGAMENRSRHDNLGQLV